MRAPFPKNKVNRHKGRHLISASGLTTCMHIHMYHKHTHYVSRALGSTDCAPWTAMLSIVRHFLETESEPTLTPEWQSILWHALQRVLIIGREAPSPNSGQDSVNGARNVNFHIDILAHCSTSFFDAHLSLHGVVPQKLVTQLLLPQAIYFSQHTHIHTHNHHFF